MLKLIKNMLKIQLLFYNFITFHLNLIKDIKHSQIAKLTADNNLPTNFKLQRTLFSHS